MSAARKTTMTDECPTRLMPVESEEECRDIYDRLAYGGTAH